MNYVDAHHHIWPATGLPWLDGPMIPRIFGPYESLQGKAYTAEEYVADATAAGFSQSVYVQANWKLEDSLEEVQWVHEQHERTGWPHAIVGSADLFDANAFETLQAQAELSPLMRGTRLQLHWHEHEAFRFASGPDRAHGPDLQREHRAAAGARLRLRAAGLPEPAGVRHAARAGDHPDVTFVLIHAGMPIDGEPWRDALRELSHHPNVNVKLSGQGTFVHRVDPELHRARSPRSCSTRSAPGARCSAPTSRSRACGPTFLAL